MFRSKNENVISCTRVFLENTTNSTISGRSCLSVNCGIFPNYMIIFRKIHIPREVPQSIHIVYLLFIYLVSLRDLF